MLLVKYYVMNLGNNNKWILNYVHNSFIGMHIICVKF